MDGIAVMIKLYNFHVAWFYDLSTLFMHFPLKMTHMKFWNMGHLATGKKGFPMDKIAPVFLIA